MKYSEQVQKKRKRIYNKAKKIIVEKDIIFLNELISYLPIHIDTYYEYFPVASEESEALKEMIEQNKINKKKVIQKRWFDNEHDFKAQLALYKIIGTDEERKKLSQSYIDHTSKDKELKPTEIVIRGADGKELEV